MKDKNRIIENTLRRRLLRQPIRLVKTSDWTKNHELIFILVFLDRRNGGDQGIKRHGLSIAN